MNIAFSFKNFEPTLDNGTSSRFVQRDRTLELQSVSVGYRLDSKSFRQKTKLNYLDFSINMSNVAYWSTVKRERGLDYPFAHNVIGTMTIVY